MLSCNKRRFTVVTNETEYRQLVAALRTAPANPEIAQSPAVMTTFLSAKVGSFPLSPGGIAIATTPNAGGASVCSEVLSFETLHCLLVSDKDLHICWYPDATHCERPQLEPKWYLYSCPVIMSIITTHTAGR
jgi:hypothetical protein